MKYYGKKALNNAKVYEDTTNTIFRTMWAFPSAPKSFKGKDCDFEKVGAQCIIIDIDDDSNVHNALTIAIDTVEYLIKKYDIECSVWFSGKKGFHIAIPFHEFIELDTRDIGKASRVVTAYENLLQELEKNIDDAVFDHTLQQVTRVIQQPNKHKDKQDKERGYKICIGNNTTIEMNIDTIRAFSKQNQNIYSPIIDASNNQFIDHLHALNTLKNNAPTHNSFSIVPLAEKLYKIHGERHTQVIGAIAWCCVDYLTHDEAEEFLKQLQSIPIINESSNLENSFWEAYDNGNNGLGNLYTLLELDTNTTEKHERQKLFNDFKQYLESKNPNAQHQQVGAITINDINIQCILIEDFDTKLLKYESIFDGIDLILDFTNLIGRFIYTETGEQVHSFRFKIKDDFFEIVKFKETADFLKSVGIELPKFFQEIIRNHLNSLDKAVLQPVEHEDSPVNAGIDHSKFEGFTRLLTIYDNDPIRVFDNNLKLYLGNSENLFKLVIHGLGAYLKIVSRLVILNGGSSGGKSRLAKQLKNMMPNFENIGRSTFAYVSGIDDPYYYDGSILYGGDKGLTIEQEENFEQIMAFLGELATDKYIKKGFRPNNEEKVVEFFVNGLLYFVAEPYTNLSTFKASDQMKSRTTYITVTPLRKEQSIQLRRAKHENGNQDEPFESMHCEYIRYIVDNPLEVDVALELELKILELTNYDERTTDYYIGLFNSYCQYLRISKPNEDDLKKFLDIFYVNIEVTTIEYMVYKKLYKNLKVLKDEEFETMYRDGWNEKTDMLNSRKDRKSKALFTVKKVKTYFKTDFKRNKHLKDVIDSLSEILENLFNADLLGRLETPSGQENIYYIKYNEELEEKED